MKTFVQLVSDGLHTVKELFPWDLVDELAIQDKPLLIDIREADEYNAMHISGSIHVPRGILESACDYGYAETEPRLAAARNNNVVIICRSGNRSVLAVQTMISMGYQNVRSLKTGLRGWNDDEQKLVNANGSSVDIDTAEAFLSPPVSPEKMAKST